VPQLQYPWDLGEVSYAFQDQFKLMVLGRSPVLTRPPADYRLVFQGRYYDVFRRVSRPVVLRHVIASDRPDAPLYRPPALTCREITRLGTQARTEHGRIAFSTPTAASSVEAIHSTHPATWVPLPIDTGTIPHGLTLLPGAGMLRTTLHVPRTGHYSLWVQGSLTQKMTVSVNGRRVGSIAQQIGPGTIFTNLGTVRLNAGTAHVVLTRAARSRLIPSKEEDSLGDIVLSRTGAPPAVRYASPAHARSLCGHDLQWVEIVR
jgi:hypothetical protein